MFGLSFSPGGAGEKVGGGRGEPEDEGLEVCGFPLPGTIVCVHAAVSMTMAAAAPTERRRARVRRMRAVRTVEGPPNIGGSLSTGSGPKVSGADGCHDSSTRHGSRDVTREMGDRCRSPGRGRRWGPRSPSPS